uniref:Uncharacterized protein n=1 Tax=Myotis myotis TaxID=51298 RepID=A0A7J8ANQ4_MYOMY|nr:hypothetical protein mMyoMyo1_008169 [Myotis myotis]
MPPISWKYNFSPDIGRLKGVGLFSQPSPESRSRSRRASSDPTFEISPGPAAEAPREAPRGCCTENLVVHELPTTPSPLPESKALPSSQEQTHCHVAITPMTLGTSYNPGLQDHVFQGPGS